MRGKAGEGECGASSCMVGIPGGVFLKTLILYHILSQLDKHFWDLPMGPELEVASVSFFRYLGERGRERKRERERC